MAVCNRMVPPCLSCVHSALCLWCGVVPCVCLLPLPSKIGGSAWTIGGRSSADAGTATTAGAAEPRLAESSTSCSSSSWPWRSPRALRAEARRGIHRCGCQGAMALVVFVVYHFCRGDRRIAMVTVTQRGCALGFASGQLGRDREVVMETVVEPFSRLNERFAEYGWKPRRDVLAPKSLSRAPTYRYICVNNRGVQVRRIRDFKNNHVSTAYRQPLT